MKGHTPTPWILDTTMGGDPVISDSLGRYIALMVSPSNSSGEDGAHIVKCVNAHDDLVKVLKLSTNVLETLHACESRDDARKMLGELIMANRAVLEKATT